MNGHTVSTHKTVCVCSDREDHCMCTCQNLKSFIILLVEDNMNNLNFNWNHRPKQMEMPKSRDEESLSCILGVMLPQIMMF